MVKNVNSNKKGFTLIELLVSVVVALIVFGGLYVALMTYTKYNIITALRNQAITIAQSCVNDIRAGDNCPDNVIVRYRNFETVFNISAPKPSSFAGGTYNNVVVTVSYGYGGKSYSYSINTVVYKQ